MNKKTYITALDFSSGNDMTSPFTSGKSTQRTLKIKKVSSKALSKSSSMKEMKINSKEEKALAIRLKQNFLDFLIQDQTNFADLEQVQNFYSDRVLDNKRKYNDNLIRIKKLQEEDEQLSIDIFKEIIKHYTIQKTTLDAYYDLKIDRLKEIVNMKNHNLECYQNMYKRLYKANYLVKKRLEEEMKYDVVSQKQFEKYEILNNHALQTVKKQSSMLKNVQNFMELTQATYKSEIVKKTKQFNELEFQVFTLKKDTNAIEIHIKKVKQSQDELKKKIQINNQANINNFIENQSYLREYLCAKMKLNKIYDILKVKSLNDIIKKFNNLQKEYVSYSQMFAKINSEIANLNLEKTELDNIYETTMLKVNLLKTNSSYDEARADTEVIIVKEEKNLVNRQFEAVKKANLECEQLFKIVMLFMVNYTNKFKNSMRLSYIPHFFSCRSHYESKRYFKKFYDYNEKTRQYALKAELLSCEHSYDFDKKLIEFCLVIFNDFVENFFLIISNAFNIVSSDIISDSVDYSNLSNKNKSSKLQITPYSSQIALNSFDKNVNNAFSHYERKIQIYNRSDKDIFDTRKSNRNSAMKKIERHSKMSKFTTIEELYKNFIKKFCKDPYILQSSYLKYHPMRSIALVRKYANENVFDTKKRMIMNRAQSTTNIQTGENTGRINQKDKNVLSEGKEYNKSFSIDNKKRDFISREYNYEFDSDDDFYAQQALDNARKKKKGNIPRFMLSTNDVQKDIIYKRMNDIRKLELHYHQDIRGGKSGKQVNNDQFNDIYYTFKKKFLKKEYTFPKLTKSKSVTNVHSKAESSRSAKPETKEGTSAVIDNNTCTNTSNKISNTVGKSTHNHFVSGSTSAMNKTGMSAVTFNQSHTSNFFFKDNTGNNNNDDSYVTQGKEKMLVQFK